ncbi:hypothetical protein UF75_1538 [Desulfosporosinus sp. I2]|nr:hypothetical protein UF75_1538 [Desulfosporosinus sp. I2]
MMLRVVPGAKVVKSFVLQLIPANSILLGQEFELRMIH